MPIDPKNPFRNIPSWEGIEALSLVLDERSRQIDTEGHTSAHDDEHTEGQLALLAAVYALSSRRALNPDSHLALIKIRNLVEVYGCPYKPKDPIRDLTRAGALILAELERRLRADTEGKYISPDYDPSRPVGGTNHPNRRGPNEPHPFKKD